MFVIKLLAQKNVFETIFFDLLNLDLFTYLITRRGIYHADIKILVFAKILVLYLFYI